MRSLSPADFRINPTLHYALTDFSNSSGALFRIFQSRIPVLLVMINRENSNHRQIVYMIFQSVHLCNAVVIGSSTSPPSYFYDDNIIHPIYVEAKCAK